MMKFAQFTLISYLLLLSGVFGDKVATTVASDAKVASTDGAVERELQGGWRKKCMNYKFAIKNPMICRRFRMRMMMMMRMTQAPGTGRRLATVEEGVMKGMDVRELQGGYRKKCMNFKYALKNPGICRRFRMRMMMMMRMTKAPGTGRRILAEVKDTPKERKLVEDTKDKVATTKGNEERELQGGYRKKCMNFKYALKNPGICRRFRMRMMMMMRMTKAPGTGRRILKEVNADVTTAAVKGTQETKAVVAGEEGRELQGGYRKKCMNFKYALKNPGICRRFRMRMMMMMMRTRAPSARRILAEVKEPLAKGADEKNAAGTKDATTADRDLQRYNGGGGGGGNLRFKCKNKKFFLKNKQICNKFRMRMMMMMRTQAPGAMRVVWW